jgi:hypothetical protein
MGLEARFGKTFGPSLSTSAKRYFDASLLQHFFFHVVLLGSIPSRTRAGRRGPGCLITAGKPGFLDGTR